MCLGCEIKFINSRPARIILFLARCQYFMKDVSTFVIFHGRLPTKDKLSGQVLVSAFKYYR